MSEKCQKRTHLILKPSQKLEVILESEKNPLLTQINLSIDFSRIFKKSVSRRTVSNILKDKEKNTGDILICINEIYPELENGLVIWLELALKSNLIIKDEVLIN